MGSGSICVSSLLTRGVCIKQKVLAIVLQIFQSCSVLVLLSKTLHHLIGISRCFYCLINGWAPKAYFICQLSMPACLPGSKCKIRIVLLRIGSPFQAENASSVELVGSDVAAVSLMPLDTHFKLMQGRVERFCGVEIFLFAISCLCCESWAPWFPEITPLKVCPFLWLFS